MDTIARFALLMIQAYLVLFALIGAHRLRRRYGLDLYFILIGGLIVYMWWVTRLGLDALTIGEISLPISTIAYFSSIFATLLVVYISDGVRMTQRLILSVIALQALFLLMEVFTQLLLSVSPALPFALPAPFIRLHWQELLWSSIALILDMLVVIIVYQAMQNRLPRWHPILKIWMALAVALALDSAIYVTGTKLGDPSFTGTLISQILGRIVMAGAIAPALSWYITREIAKKTQGIGTFDIFRSVDLLTRSLHHTKTKYDALLAHSDEAVVVVNPKGFVVEANRRFWEMTGYKASESEQLHYSTFIHRDNRPELVATMSVILEGKQIDSQHIIKGMRKNGQGLHVSATMRLLTEEGEITGVLMILKDITDQTLIESRLSSVSELASLSRVKSEIIAHLSTLIQTQGELPQDAAERADIARMVKHLNEILDSLDREDKPERLPLRQLLDEALAFHKTRLLAQNITPETHFGEPEPHVTGSRSKLMLLLIHLLDNAIYWAAEAEQPIVKIDAELTNNGSRRRRLELRVSNSGPAIPKDAENRIYAPFFTSEPDEKPGLGLTVCRHIVNQYGGSISHKRIDGLTEALVTLPADATKARTHTELA